MDDHTQTKINPEPNQSEQFFETNPVGNDKPGDHKTNFMKKLSPKKLIAEFKKLPKKQKIIIILAAALVIISGIALWWFVFRGDGNQPAAISQLAEQEAPATVPSELTGLPVKPEVNSKQVTAVMIENSPDARPQSGLKDAGLVFEAIAEAGITRFMALYQDSESNYIGPVRSARPYYLDWLMPFDAAYGHVGGSPRALQLIKMRNIKDLDQFGAAGAYERVSSRYAPHNVYTNTDKLNKIEKERGFTKSIYRGFARKTSEDPTDTPSAKTINFAISSPLYNVRYDYQKSSNSYKRNMAGQPHKDEKSGKQLSSKVVVALVMPYRLARDGYHSVYQTTGKGKLFIFQDGQVIKGTWHKQKPGQQFEFKDKTGEIISLTPGKTWITIVSSGDQVTYKP